MDIQVMSGKTALVTGACGGIGSAIAIRLASEGACVAVHYGSTYEAGLAVVEQIKSMGGRAFTISGNICSTSEITDLFNQADKGFIQLCGTSRLDILVNNAGMSAPFGPVELFSEEIFDLLVSTNFKGPFFVTKQAIPRLQDGGHIINISSISTKAASPMLAAYAASKTTINSLTKSLALELAPRRIHVNAVLPGLVLTKLTQEVKDNPAMLEQSTQKIPYNRVGEPEDIANVVAALVSSSFNWVTGQLIEATGGAAL